jgi:hypothetical protein
VADDSPLRGGLLVPAAVVGAQELEVSWGRALRVWWAMAWRCLLAVPLGGLVGCVIGGVIGAIGGALRLDTTRIQILVQLVTVPVGLVLGGLVGIWATRAVLRKRFKEFRIALIPRTDG